MLKNKLKNLFTLHEDGKPSSPSSNQNDTYKKSDDNPIESATGVFALIRNTSRLSNAVVSLVTKELILEPLPFTDYSLFEENYSKLHFYSLIESDFCC